MYKRQLSSTSDCRRVITSWFSSRASPLEHSALNDFVQNLVTNAFVECVSKDGIHCRRRHRKSSQSAAVPEAILVFADHLTGAILQAAQQQLRTSAVCSSSDQPAASLQSVAESFARSIVDDALAGQRASASSSQHLLVSSAGKYEYQR